MNRKQNGRLAEVKVAAWMIENGYEVYLPLSDGSVYDMLVVRDDQTQRVSVKYTSERKPSGKWRVCLVQTSRRNNSEMHTVKFDNSRYDVLAVYIGPEDRIVLIPCNEISAMTEVSVSGR